MDPVSLGLGGQMNQPGQIRRREDTDTNAAQSASKSAGDFSSALTNALNEVQELQDKADESLEKLVTAQTQDIHQVMVAYEQARLSMQTMVEVRNKLVEAYQEISRMPV